MPKRPIKMFFFRARCLLDKICKNVFCCKVDSGNAFKKTVFEVEYENGFKNVFFYKVECENGFKNVFF